MNVDVVVGVCPCVFDIGLEFDVVHDLDVDVIVWFLGIAVVDVVVCVDGSFLLLLVLFMKMMLLIVVFTLFLMLTFNVSLY